MFNKKLVLGLFVFVLVASVVAGFETQVSISFEIGYPEEGVFYTESIDYFVISGNDTSNPPAECWYKLNEVFGDYVSCSKDIPLNLDQVLEEGSYNLTVYMRNATATPEPYSVSDNVEFKVDSLAPRVQFVVPASNPVYLSQDNIYIEVNVIELFQDKITFQLYNGGLINETVDDSAPFITSIDWENLGNDEYTVTVIVEDTVGHSTSVSTQIILDTVPPDLINKELSSEYLSPEDGNGIFDELTIVMNASELVDWGRTSVYNVSDEVKYFSGPLGYVLDNLEVWDGTIKPSLGVNADDDVYMINTTLTDRAGNVAVISVGSVIVDNTKPVIVLNGDNPQTIEVFDAYVELGATASDNNPISNNIIIDASDVNVNVLGNYIVNYDVKDDAGNDAVTVVRDVDVVDTTDPEIILLGDNPQIIELGDEYIELGATASDNYYGDITEDVIIDTEEVDIGTVGNYEVTYDVVDGSGNSDSKIRTVDVVDTTAPVISLVFPDDNTPFEIGDEISFEFDEVELDPDSCSLRLNEDVYEDFESENSIDNLEAGKYFWNISCVDMSENEGISEIGVFTVLADLDFPEDTDYTDLPNEEDISKVNFFVKNEYGMINWTLVDLSAGLNWADFIEILYNNAEVDSVGANELNTNANVELYNLSWNDPRVLKDGVVCSDCVKNSYVGGNLSFDVAGFSAYTTDETPVSSGNPSSGGRYRPPSIIVENVTEEEEEVGATASEGVEAPVEEGIEGITGAVVGGGDKSVVKDIITGAVILAAAGLCIFLYRRWWVVKNNLPGSKE